MSHLDAAMGMIKIEAGLLDDFSGPLSNEEFAELVNGYLEEMTTYWRPSDVAPSEGGVEMVWPNGRSMAIERHTDKWFLETEDELFPLESTDPISMSDEIVRILQEHGYIEDLSEVV